MKVNWTSRNATKCVLIGGFHSSVSSCCCFCSGFRQFWGIRVARGPPCTAGLAGRPSCCSAEWTSAGWALKCMTSFTRGTRIGSPSSRASTLSNVWIWQSSIWGGNFIGIRKRNILEVAVLKNVHYRCTVGHILLHPALVRNSEVASRVRINNRRNWHFWLDKQAVRDHLCNERSGFNSHTGQIRQCCDNISPRGLLRCWSEKREIIWILTFDRLRSFWSIYTSALTGQKARTQLNIKMSQTSWIDCHAPKFPC